MLDKADLLAESDLYYWSLKNRRIKGQPFTIVPPLKHLYQDPTTEIFIEKAAQVFISEYLINVAFFVSTTGWAQRGNALYIFPYTPQISDFSNARVEPEILMSPYLSKQRQLVKDLMGGAATNNIQLKQFLKGFMYFRGSTQRQQIISVDADAVLFDEVDEMMDGTIEAGKKRATSSLMPIYRGASTPKYPHTGIDALLERSDRKVWMVKCERCGYQQDLAKVQDVVFEIPSNNIDLLQVTPNEEKGTYCHIGSKYYIACPRCKKVLNVWNGEWVRTVTVDVEFGGYHVPKLISNRLPFDELATRVERERDGKMDETQKQEFYNSDLGLPRAPQGAQISLNDLQACSLQAPEDFMFHSRETREAWESWYEFPESIRAGFMGVDVGFKRLHVCILAFPAHNECLRRLTPENNPVLVYSGSVFTKENIHGFKELDPYMAKWQILKGVVDSMPDKRTASEFQRRHSGRIYTCSYVNWKKKANLIYEYNIDKGIVNSGRTETLDVVSNYILTQRLVLPRNVQFVGGNINVRNYGEFSDHIMNVSKIYNSDRKEYDYVEGAKPDHFFHALNYAFIAAGVSPLSGDIQLLIPDSMDKVVDSFSVKETAFDVFHSLRFSGTGSEGGNNNGRKSRYSRSGNRPKAGPGFGGY